MKKATTIQEIPARPGQRILVMSDIHGHMDNLFHLLKKLNYSRDDILVIIGDLVDKGPDSLRTLRYIMELSERGNVYVSMG
ncbi:MAG: metallophosphoesterase, partial [Lachnospiraceae bacterium]|nr:metallophosphoesterase [Lachnospiraceae bacterium]